MSNPLSHLRIGLNGWGCRWVRRDVVGNYLTHNKLTEGMPNTSLKSI